MMPCGEKSPAVRIYTVCDESKYLIARNVPSIGCGEELRKLFASYGYVEDCKPMDGEHFEPFTEAYRIKFQHVDNARFAKRKLDEVAFYGNLLQVSYAPQFETLLDTKEKLEGRSREVLTRIRQADSELSRQTNLKLRKYPESVAISNTKNAFPAHVSSDKDYFTSPSMNKTVQLVREKLDVIASSGDSSAGPVAKKPRVDNRRRI